MSGERPIATAPMDGSKVTVLWRDRDEQENRSIAQYRSVQRLKPTGGDWDETDEGWWAFVDSDTQIRVEPHSWKPDGPDEDD
ncbi:MAG: hypothetical protein KKB66_19765 [Alphaproteobacteria bacterium]|jgi:hypothetical protein|nr:hypothetical protein [Alphaproteobacteria bacterium]MBU0803845.1 hypothetical protein [Alphaproteobacteria bacterium]MBU0872858.1 hypothetical protein [Alphaproteobacteria bacterium]MBU1402772.1 hypothetical protein [Alphaproteobacteria bacterium]MBU1593414.1 hypothetical protein [Alphaproteobacteria bacterium]